MKQGTILSHQPYGGSDVAFTVEFDSIDEKLTRVYFVTDEGISRHVDKDNLNLCLDPDSGYRFNVDAFFFMKEKAIREAELLLNCDWLSGHHRHYLERQIEKWTPTQKIQNSSAYGQYGSGEVNKTMSKSLNSMVDAISHGSGNKRVQNRIMGKINHSIVPDVREEPKIGRNAPCPCDSGKKYKKCCKDK